LRKGLQRRVCEQTHVESTANSFLLSHDSQVTFFSRTEQDLNLARNAARSVDVPLPLGSSSIEIYEDVSKDSDMAGKDFSVVFKYLKDIKDRGAAKGT